MDYKFAGKCVYGPYDGQERIHYSKSMHVVWIEGNPLKEIPFKREGHYEFMDSVWIWNGPTYQKPKMESK